ncbi:MAG TPA: DNA-binding protein [Alphaproteobacteria bacterium]|nr:DNA-binding protein [Alphaproteobacteria bacterium]HBF97786.1 DNA-binding protein [Alphaproteobacteria bacterium]HCO90194.1 DNA-binding protein [Alphaproteobacteria bacterium]
MSNTDYYLPEGLPAPMAARDGLDMPYRKGLEEDKLVVQRCNDCKTWQWGPEWICHSCHSFDIGWEEVAPTGKIYSWERAWHPVHPALKDHGPYIVVLVELPHADNIRMVGNLLGDPRQEIEIGADVEAVFEHHKDAKMPFTLVQWRVAG